MIVDVGLAPADASYITQTPASGLSAAQALSALATGLLKNTTGTGVLSIASAADIPDLSATYLTVSAAAATYQPLGSYATLAGVETLTNKTLTTPTVASFTNATHSHQDATGGGTLSAAAIASGTLAAARGGTGVSNTGTITLGGNLTTSGAFATTFTMTAATGVTFPTTGTLATLAGAESLTNKKLGSLTSNGYVKTSGGDGTLSVETAISLTADVSGVLPVANGGTNASSASITAFNNITGYSASGATGTTSTNLVFSTSPTLTTPDIGVATATSVNKVAITAPATSATLTIANGKTLTANNTLTLAGTDSTTMTFPTTSATIARTDAANSFTGDQTFSGVIAGANGTASLPAFTFSSNTNTGIYRQGTNSIGFAANGSEKFRIGSSALISLATHDFNNNLLIGISALRLSNSNDLRLNYGGAAVLTLGDDVNGAAVAQTVQSCAGVTGTDKTGADFTIQSGVGTGAGAVSSLFFKTPTVAASGTTAQTRATRLTVTSGLVSLADATDLGIGTSTGSKIGQATSLIGFYGVTPIARAVLATGAGATADNIITALQNLGLVKQS